MATNIIIIEQVSSTEVIVQCARCKGYGTVGKSWNDPGCPTCNGKGKILLEVERLPLVECARCQGYGTLGNGWKDPECPSCHGVGCQPIAGRMKIIK